MGWDGPILTDSGGFQVFSLRDTIVRADDDGVTFRSVYDGEEARFTPGARCGDPGAARLRHRHVPRHLPARRTPPRRSSSSPRRARPAGPERQLAAPRAEGQLLFGIAQGGTDGELRRRSDRGDRGARLRRARARRPERGGGPRRDARDRRLGGAAPAGRPTALLHGHRRPGRASSRSSSAASTCSTACFRRGSGAPGSALTWEGRLNLRNARFARDPAPLEEGCPCRACTGFSRAYLRHLVNQQELLGLDLLSEHNVRFLLDLTAGRPGGRRAGRARCVQGGCARPARLPDRNGTA